MLEEDVCLFVLEALGCWWRWDGVGVLQRGDILRRCKLGASFETGGGRMWFRVVVVVVLWVMLGLLATDGGQEEWVVRLWLVRCVGRTCRVDGGTCRGEDEMQVRRE